VNQNSDGSLFRLKTALRTFVDCAAQRRDTPPTLSASTIRDCAIRSRLHRLEAIPLPPIFVCRRNKLRPEFQRRTLSALRSDDNPILACFVFERGVNLDAFPATLAWH
jgi:hypothetical protein